MSAAASEAGENSVSARRQQFIDGAVQVTGPSPHRTMTGNHDPHRLGSQPVMSAAKYLPELQADVPAYGEAGLPYRLVGTGNYTGNGREFAFHRVVGKDQHPEARD
ncbi:hypothetical protein BH23CHL3_BH23CHL3_02350 [soil metagenome]